MSKYIEIRTGEDWKSFLGEDTEKIIFKYSPVCGISSSTEAGFENWLSKAGDTSGYSIAKIDVIFSRELVREIAAKLGVKHESPQLLWLNKDNSIKLHASHFGISSLLANNKI